MEKDQLTPRQFMTLVTLFSVGTGLLVVPAIVASEAKQDAWISGVLNIVMGFLLVWLYKQIAKQHPGCSLFQINERVFGTWIGKVVTLLIVFSVLLFCSQVLYYFGSFIITQMMPTTPIEAIHILLIIYIMMGAKLGIVVLARTSEIFFPWVVLLFLVFMVLIIPQMQLNKILPIGEATFLPLFRSGFNICTYSALQTFTVFSMLVHKVSPIQKAYKAYYIGTTIAGVMLLLLIVTSILVLGPDNTAKQIFPSYELAQRIEIGKFLQRIEVIIAFLWLISIFFKMSMFFYVTIQGISFIFKMPNYKILIFPVGIIITVLSFIVYPNMNYQQQWDEHTWPPYAILIGLVYPLLILLLGFLHKARMNYNAK
ncbi:GerAB/ArcD/ProY family transporter [Paenibacillus sp. LMG 31461]|uniref:GerAB/ArcD/ProY family transporter n=1 Tax=Paenibacillus plantarum TaxID=2654975 RepID=A0ABX1XL76_9BACL|nr:endospore germination permease [Paenibacillus plantarum]NOU69288.1 GerAB/ArcD/ProY family transporter [Paenibacillus plantarum]